MASDTKAQENQPIYRDIDGSNVEDLESTEIESLCMECHEKVCITLTLSYLSLLFSKLEMYPRAGFMWGIILLYYIRGRLDSC